MQKLLIAFSTQRTLLVKALNRLQLLGFGMAALHVLCASSMYLDSELYGQVHSSLFILNPYVR